jgi:hypothetical protein
MAGRRKSWESLSPSYRGRLSRGGVTRSQFESGAPIRKARGHAKTPEHGIAQGLRNPDKFREYLGKKNIPQKTGGGKLDPQEEAMRLNDMKDKAYRGMRQLANYFKYNDETVRDNVYGSEENPKGMSYSQALWTSTADIEEIRSMARDQYRNNPWFYH